MKIVIKEIKLLNMFVLRKPMKEIKVTEEYLNRYLLDNETYDLEKDNFVAKINERTEVPIIVDNTVNDYWIGYESRYTK